MAKEWSRQKESLGSERPHLPYHELLFFAFVFFRCDCQKQKHYYLVQLWFLIFYNQKWNNMHIYSWLYREYPWANGQGMKSAKGIAWKWEASPAYHELLFFAFFFFRCDCQKQKHYYLVQLWFFIFYNQKWNNIHIYSRLYREYP